MSAGGAAGAYDLAAASLAARYEGLDPEVLHAPLSGLLRRGEGRLALDVGAGSGRNAAWLLRKGFEVVACEPAAGMRREGRTRHGSGIRWLADDLPGLDATHRLGLAFDVILLSAVWQHVAPPDRPRAYRKLATPLRPEGRAHCRCSAG